jgi:hypothetical protein
MKVLCAVVIALAILGALLDHEWDPAEIPAIELEAVKAKLGASQEGAALIIRDQEFLAEWVVQDYFEQDRVSREEAASTWIWQDYSREPAIVSAPGQDGKHHFSNSYLVGVLPFVTENKWLPLYALDKRKTYELDSDQYGPEEVWQTSAEAFVQLRGDCEDHAIVLADWLISLGVDARVVLGEYEGTGHAWVVAFQNSQTFLLEATEKRRYKAWNHYPLAQLAEGYRPAFMFNRSTFWVNEGSLATADYQGEHWRESATYIPAAADDQEG